MVNLQNLIAEDTGAPRTSHLNLVLRRLRVVYVQPNARVVRKKVRNKRYECNGQNIRIEAVVALRLMETKLYF